MKHSSNIRLLSHMDHNPACDIVEVKLGPGRSFNLVLYVNGPKSGERAAEYYSGPNYHPEAGPIGSAKSYSRYWPSLDQVPAKYQDRIAQAIEAYPGLQQERASRQG